MAVRALSLSNCVTSSAMFIALVLSSCTTTQRHPEMQPDVEVPAGQDAHVFVINCCR
jgi:hypothetical protein